MNLTLKESECNLSTHLVGRNSIPSLKPTNDELLKLLNSMEFKGFHEVHYANQTSLRWRLVRNVYDRIVISGGVGIQFRILFGWLEMELESNFIFCLVRRHVR